MKQDDTERSLTDKETAIVAALIDGETVDDIAGKTHRHVSTIYEHLTRARKRIGVQTDIQLAVFAVCRGFVSCDQFLKDGDAGISPR